MNEYIEHISWNLNRNTNATTGLPLNLFSPPGSARHAVRCDAPFNETTPYNWIVAGIESGSAGLPAGRLVLLAQRILATPGRGLGFAVLGTTLIAVDNAASGDPTLWNYRSTNLTSCQVSAVAGSPPPPCETWAAGIFAAPANDCVGGVGCAGDRWSFGAHAALAVLSQLLHNTACFR